MASCASASHGSRCFRVPSPCNNTSLLARIGFLRTDAADGKEELFDTVFVYLHGFPDMAVDYRPGRHGAYASRLPRKLNEALVEKSPRAAFVCFNFSGIPGSDENFPFVRKSISAEVADAVAVVNFVKDNHLRPSGSIHIIGLSTGAIVASLLRGILPAQNESCSITITVIAGLLDLKTGLQYDFDESQASVHDPPLAI